MSGIQIVATPVNVEPAPQLQLIQDRSINQELAFLKNNSGVNVIAKTNKGIRNERIDPTPTSDRLSHSATIRTNTEQPVIEPDQQMPKIKSNQI